MREALRESLKGALRETVVYPRGSIVLCASCGKPLYRLERGIGAGDKAGRAVSAFAPVRSVDLDFLLARPDVEPGLRAAIKALDGAHGRADFLHKIPSLRSGDPALCPICGRAFVFGQTAEKSDTIDRAYVLRLLTVPPKGWMS